MVRKMSIKRKYRNRRLTKRKHGDRMTKKVQRRVIKKRNTQKGGGGYATIPYTQQVDSDKPVWKFNKDSDRRIVVKRTEAEIWKYAGNVSILWVNTHIKDIIDNMETEEDIIELLESIKYDVNYKYDKSYFRPNMTLSLLSHLIIPRPDVSLVKHKLIRWLIQHGANVNFEISVSSYKTFFRTKTPTTILSEAIKLLLNTELPEFKAGELSLRVLYDFYNCVYTLVLLLLRKADLTKNFNTDTGVKTPLSILLENQEKIKSFEQICKMRSMPTEGLLTLLDLSSQAVYRTHKELIERVLTKLKLLVVPFEMFLTITATPIPTFLTDLNISCVTAISEIGGNVVWMKEMQYGVIEQDIDKVYMWDIERAFNRGDATLVLGTTELRYVGQHKYDFTKMTMTTDYNKSERRIWRDWRPDEKDVSEEVLSKELINTQPRGVVADV